MFRLVAKILYTILLIVETLIALRLVFVFVAANPSNPVVAFVLKYSDIFVNPFRGIITNTVRLGSFTVDTTALLALIVYMVIAFIVIEMIRAFSHSSETR